MTKIHFTLINKQYVNKEDGSIVTVDELMKYTHSIKGNHGWYEKKEDIPLIHDGQMTLDDLGNPS